MLTFIAYAAIAAFIGLAILGHILVLQALFTSADRTDGTREKLPPRNFIPDVRISSTQRDVSEGRDRVLEEGVEVLRAMH